MKKIHWNNKFDYFPHNVNSKWQKNAAVRVTYIFESLHAGRKNIQIAEFYGVNNSAAFLQIRKSNFRTEKNQRNTTSSCGSQENQKPVCGWTYQQQLTSKHFVRHSTTSGTKKLNPFYDLLKLETPINKMSELREIFDTVKSKKTAQTRCQTCVDTASFRKTTWSEDRCRSVSYALMVEDNPEQQSHSKRLN